MIDSDLTPKILLRAYEIWESEGCPHGRDQAHWYKAEAEIANGDPSPVVALSKPKRKPRSSTPRK